MIKPQNPPLGSKQVLLPSFCIAGKPVLGLRLIFWKAASNSGCLQIIFLFPGVLKVLSPCFCDKIRQCLGSTWSSAHAEKREGDAKMRGEAFWVVATCELCSCCWRNCPTAPSGSQLAPDLPAPAGQESRIWRSSLVFFSLPWASCFGLLTIIPGIR